MMWRVMTLVVMVMMVGGCVLIRDSRFSELVRVSRARVGAGQGEAAITSKDVVCAEEATVGEGAGVWGGLLAWIAGGGGFTGLAVLLVRLLRGPATSQEEYDTLKKVNSEAKTPGESVNV